MSLALRLDRLPVCAGPPLLARGRSLPVIPQRAGDEVPERVHPMASGPQLFKGKGNAGG